MYCTHSTLGIATHSSTATASCYSRNSLASIHSIPWLLVGWAAPSYILIGRAGPNISWDIISAWAHLLSNIWHLIGWAASIIRNFTHLIGWVVPLGLLVRYGNVIIWC